VAEHKHQQVSTRTCDWVLYDAGIAWQATNTWKASQDPALASKMVRILALYAAPLADRRMICVDEFGLP
jgi:hypothetical protein